MSPEGYCNCWGKSLEGEVWERVNGEVRERGVIGFLDFFVLGVLARKQSVSVCDLMECAEQKLGFSLNAHILYCQLFYLEREGLVCSSSIGNDKIYSITRMGKNKISKAEKKKSAIMWVVDQMLKG